MTKKVFENESENGFLSTHSFVVFPLRLKNKESNYTVCSTYNNTENFYRHHLFSLFGYILRRNIVDISCELKISKFFRMITIF